MKNDQEKNRKGDGPEILVFGGTIEGRRLSDYLASREIPHTVCVATEYGEEVLEPRKCRTVRRGRMDTEEMRRFLREENFAAVVDATHPYAVEVSKNIRAACDREQKKYVRYLRAESGAKEDGRHVWVDSAREAACYLETQSGVVFLTTGSKELHVFTEEISEKSRLFARVLPSAEVIASCRALGLEGKQICGMQGPFSQAMNEAMLLQTGAEWLVTKNTGVSGGFPEKLRAAENCGVRCVIIRRPEETGADWEELVKLLESVTGRNESSAGTDMEKESQDPGAEKETPPRRISCIGIGMGTPDTLTYEAAREIREAEIVFGAGRILESAKALWNMPAPEGPQKKREPVLVPEYEGTKIASYLAAHPEYRRAAVLMSGDVGFYSGARGIAAAFSPEEVRYFCGISSVVYFASKVPTAWQDAKLLSAHGKQVNLQNYVRRYPKIILLVSGAGDVERICAELDEAGFGQVRVTVGTNLSYPEETVTVGRPADFLSCRTKGLHIMMIENGKASYVVSPGVPDERFVRGKVPMTKEEIRILSVAKLRLTQDAVVYDVGAGTGSVAVECARLCTAGTVYAIEKNPEGIALIRENSRKMQVSNVVTVEGMAPQALEALPAPTHAFIGGSSGNMKEIVEMLQRKNPDVRIVINTIALESLAEATRLLQETGAKNADIVQASVAKSRVLGRYHMMGALNPVYIISFGGTDR